MGGETFLEIGGENSNLEKRVKRSIPAMKNQEMGRGRLTGKRDLYTRRNKKDGWKKKQVHGEMANTSKETKGPLF